MIAFLAFTAGSFRSVDFFLLTESGVSVDTPYKYVIYLIIAGIFMMLALLIGKRAGCHVICWMAPFLILGRKIRNFFSWPSFRLSAEAEKCIQC